MRNGVIYCLENHLTDKMYIGKTERFEERMRQHSMGNGNAPALRAAILKYGWQHFSVKVVEEIPVEDLNEAERFWIAFLDTKAPNGYNLTDGGDGGNHAPESRELMREVALRRIDEGTHNFQTDNPNQRRLEDGTHHFLTNNPSSRRIEEGTHHFQTNNPMKNPESIAKRQRSKRKNRGIQDWVDNLTSD